MGVGAGFPSARGRISVGSGPDFRRLGAGFPWVRGRIPVAPGPSARAPGSGALPRSQNLRVSGFGWARGGGPEPRFSGTSAKITKFWKFCEIPRISRISVISVDFPDCCEKVRARGAMPKYQVFLVVSIGILEPFRPGTHFWAQNPKMRRI